MLERLSWHKLLSIIGDVHGKYPELFRVIENCGSEYILQVGDLGFDYSPVVDYLDPNHFKFLRGNHDNYDVKIPHCLGDFGKVSFGDLNFFFIRGEYSIDMKTRIETNKKIFPQKIWWHDEELNRSNMEKAFKEYKKAKPKVMITHGCPYEISKLIGIPGILKHFGHDPKTFTTNTQQLLQSCFDSNKPNVWIFGHMHQNLDFIHKGTRFICINELCHIEYKDGDFININTLNKKF
jgi:predicted phosphodiesterase